MMSTRTASLCPVVLQSYENKWSHVPSALSMYTYISTLFKSGYILASDRIVIGKPHGSQAYYIPWRELNLIESYSNLNTVLKYGQIPFVDYTIDILGDCLGVAAGISIATTSKVWVNMGDACLQMGNILEAIQYIGHNNLRNIIVTVDHNNAQRCGRCSDIVDVLPVYRFAEHCGWNVIECDGHDPEAIRTGWQNCEFKKPTMFAFKTVKGYGYPEMIDNISEWHYKTLNESDIRQILG